MDEVILVELFDSKWHIMTHVVFQVHNPQFDLQARLMTYQVFLLWVKNVWNERFTLYCQEIFLLVPPFLPILLLPEPVSPPAGYSCCYGPKGNFCIFSACKTVNVASARYFRTFEASSLTEHTKNKMPDFYFWKNKSRYIKVIHECISYPSIWKSTVLLDLFLF